MKDIKEQTEKADNLGYIKGKIERESAQEGNVIVVRYRDKDGIPVRETSIVASNDGEYLFTLIPGKHYIAAFIDANNDGSYQPEEHGNFYGTPTTIDVIRNQTVTLLPITISGPIPKLDSGIKPIKKVRAIWKNIGQVAAMDDPRFTRANYNLGLWKPFDFLDQAEGGLFFLQNYEKDKVPVIFVHGVLGGPADWKQVRGYSLYGNNYSFSLDAKLKNGKHTFDKARNNFSVLKTTPLL
ncbi:MAG: hypothetical protein JRJ41_12520 [Deltaproteobacteria bacterium]|nr:hypothetical protein [Deltaproteobacteria bacterium]